MPKKKRRSLFEEIISVNETAAGSARGQTSRIIHRKVKTSPGNNVGWKDEELHPQALFKVFARLFQKAAAGGARGQPSRFTHRRVKTSPGDNVGKKVGRTTALRLF